MQIITSFEIPPEPKFEIELPRAAVILSVSVSLGIPYLWIQHDSDAIVVWRTFILVPGRTRIPNHQDITYIGHFTTTKKEVFVFEQLKTSQINIKLDLTGGDHDN